MKIEANKIWLVVLIPTITVCLIVFLLVKSSQDRENERILYEILEEQDRQMKIDQCYELAYETYMEDWDDTCLLIGRSPGCTLPTWRADKLNKSYEDELDRCIIRFSD